MMRRGQRHILAVIGVVLSLAAFACSSSSVAPSTTGPFVVVGHVFDYRTNAAVSGATVSYGDLLSPTVLPSDPRTRSDGSGSWQLSLTAGEYHVWVDNVYRGQALVRTGVNRTDLLVQPAGCKGVYGTVGDARTGQALASAIVSFLGLTATSASDGTYRFDLGCAAQVAFGTIGLSVTRTGYQDRSLPMGRGENLQDVIRQDVDLTPR